MKSITSSNRRLDPRTLNERTRRSLDSGRLGPKKRGTISTRFTIARSPSDRCRLVPLGQDRDQGTDEQPGGELVTEAGEQIQHPPAAPKEPRQSGEAQAETDERHDRHEPKGSQLAICTPKRARHGRDRYAREELVGSIGTQISRATQYPTNPTPTTPRTDRLKRKAPATPPIPAAMAGPTSRLPSGATNPLTASATNNAVGNTSRNLLSLTLASSRGRIMKESREAKVMTAASTINAR